MDYTNRQKNLCNKAGARLAWEEEVVVLLPERYRLVLSFHSCDTKKLRFRNGHKKWLKLYHLNEKRPQNLTHFYRITFEFQRNRSENKIPPNPNLMKIDEFLKIYCISELQYQKNVKKCGN